MLFLNFIKLALTKQRIRFRRIYLLNCRKYNFLFKTTSRPDFLTCLVPAKVFRYIYLLSLCCLHLQMATAGAIEPSNSVSARRNEFATKFLSVVAESHAHDNLIFSPASIQAAMALVYLGAEGKTADEIQNALLLGAGDKDSIAATYGDFLRANFNKQDSGAQLTMANGIFVNEDLQIAPNFQQLAENYFNAQAKPMNFSEAIQSANNINSWVESRTNSKIKDLLQPDSINSETSAVLINAIYFKGLWVEKFGKESTHKANFALDAKSHVEVDMMFNDERYKYGEFKDLDTKVLEMPYENTDLTMLLLLPNKVDGLKDLEKNLENIDLNNVAAKLKIEDVELLLPKFKVEFDMDLKEQLRKLGVSTIFGESANLSSLFKNSTPQKVSEAKHKAYLEVNEFGSEAAAATYMKIVPMSLKFGQKHFKADHPFMFVIRNNDAVFFIGHVAKC